MPAPRSSGTRLRAARRQQGRAARQGRRTAGLVAIASALLLALYLTAFRSGQTRVLQTVGGNARLLAASTPQPQVVALTGALRLQLPIARPTALGFHAAGDDALSLTPAGHQGNEGAASRLAHAIFGGGGSGPTWYELGGRDGPPNSALDIGATPGTDVYAPVDGTVVGLTPYVLNGQIYGVRLDIQPQTAPSLVVSLIHLRADPALTVGSQVVGGVSKIGNVIDVSSAEQQALAEFTQDAGNNVSLEVHAAQLTQP